RVGGTFEGCHVSLLSLNQTEKIDHEVQASACRIESLSEQWLTFQMNEFSPYLGMTPTLVRKEPAEMQIEQQPCPPAAFRTASAVDPEWWRETPHELR
ncbi:hypothetical protein OL210_006876, partial [Pseudomonas aeruginosa]